MQGTFRYGWDMRRVSFAEMDCPVARSLDVIGEWWTLLIVRDAIGGARRFEDFKSTGIADNILSARLKGLVADGVFERRRYQEHPDRYEYLLTEKGRALGLVVGALRAWGKEWTSGPDNSLRLVHEACGHEISVRRYCGGCGRPLEREEVRVERATRSRDSARELFLTDAVGATPRPGFEAPANGPEAFEGSKAPTRRSRALGSAAVFAIFGGRLFGVKVREQQADHYGIWSSDTYRSELHELASRLETADADAQVEIRIGDEDPVALPAPVREALERVSAYMAASDFVAIRPLQRLLTTQQAAELLGVSRPYLIEHLLGEGEGRIPYQLRRPGSSHRRVRLADVLAFQEEVASNMATLGREELLQRRARFLNELRKLHDEEEPAY